MSSGMTGFVDRTRPTDLALTQSVTGRLSPARRQEIARKARVGLPDTNANLHSPSPKPSARYRTDEVTRQDFSTIAKPATPNVGPENAPHNPEGMNDSDYEGFDDATSLTVDQLEQGLLENGVFANGDQGSHERQMSNAHGQTHGNIDRAGERTGLEHGRSAYNEHINQDVVNEVFYRARQNHRVNGRRPHVEGRLGQHDFADMSYPTTTSGRLEDLDYNENDEDGQGYGEWPEEEIPERNLVGQRSTSQQRLRLDLPNDPQSTHLENSNSNALVPQPDQGISARPSLYKDAAQLREAERSRISHDPVFNARIQVTPKRFTKPRNTQDPSSPGQAQLQHSFHPITVLRQPNTTPPTVDLTEGRRISGTPPANVQYSKRKVTSRPDFIRVEGMEPSLQAENDVEGLYDRPFSELHVESFDSDPTDSPPALPSAILKAPLSEQLSHVASLDVDRQHAFFCSLGIEEWEEAGDWFLGQFGALLEKMKDARREKRKLVAALETELYERDQRIAVKRTEVEDALGEMKKSGMGLLNGTPRRR